MFRGSQYQSEAWEALKAKHGEEKALRIWNKAANQAHQECKADIKRNTKIMKSFGRAARNRVDSMIMEVLS